MAVHLPQCFQTLLQKWNLDCQLMFQDSPTKMVSVDGTFNFKLAVFLIASCSKVNVYTRCWTQNTILSLRYPHFSSYSFSYAPHQFVGGLVRLCFAPKLKFRRSSNGTNDLLGLF